MRPYIPSWPDKNEHWAGRGLTHARTVHARNEHGRRTPQGMRSHPQRYHTSRRTWSEAFRYPGQAMNRTPFRQDFEPVVTDSCQLSRVLPWMRSITEVRSKGQLQSAQHHRSITSDASSSGNGDGIHTLYERGKWYLRGHNLVSVISPWTAVVAPSVVVEHETKRVLGTALG